MDPDWLADDLSDSHTRVERAIGILKDNLHVPPQETKLYIPEPCQVLSFEKDLPLRDPFQLENTAACRRLATARLAD